jgi:hypothetical protein
VSTTTDEVSWQGEPLQKEDLLLYRSSDRPAGTGSRSYCRDVEQLYRDQPERARVAR